MRGIFHQELKQLKTDVLSLGELVEKAIGDSVSSLVSGDRDLAAGVNAGDDQIDRLSVAVEEDSASIAATQNPVAKDLRLIFSILFINSHLERMGDLAQNIAKISMLTKKEDHPRQLLDLIFEMGRQTQGVVHAALKSFDEGDLDLARALPRLDQPIDDLFKGLFRELAKTLETDRYFEWASNILLAARYLERVADHAVDIGERVVYLKTGRLE